MPAVAMLGAPVEVVFFNSPVANPLIRTPLIATTAKAVEPVASPVCVAFDTKLE